MGHYLKWNHVTLRAMKMLAIVKGFWMPNNRSLIQTQIWSMPNMFLPVLAYYTLCPFPSALLLNIQHTCCILHDVKTPNTDGYCPQTPQLRVETIIHHELEFFKCTWKVFYSTELQWFNYQNKNIYIFLPSCLRG